MLHFSGGATLGGWSRPAVDLAVRSPDHRDLVLETRHECISGGSQGGTYELSAGRAQCRPACAASGPRPVVVNGLPMRVGAHWRAP